MTLTDVRTTSMAKLLVAALAATAVAVSGTASADPAAQNAGPRDLGTLPGGELSWAYGINDHGVVAGFSEIAGGKSRAVRWDASGRIQNLGVLPGYAESSGFTINNSGVVAGRSYNGHVVEEAATVWDEAGRMTKLPTLPGAKLNRAYAINDIGTVVGVSSNAANVFQAVRWNKDGTLTKLRGLGEGEPFSGSAWINAGGTTSGFWGSEAVLWGPEADPAPRLLENLTLPSGPTIDKAYALSDTGIPVGAAIDKGGFTHPVKWNSEGKVTELPMLPGDVAAAAYGVSNDGSATGYSMNPIGVKRAVRWNAAGEISLMVPTTTASEGYMINERRTAVGVMTTRTNKIHAALYN
ncbi:putative HAF family extracellular repeat protein [Saccharothrix carnea]|uniref:Putative HAF family extracellular repeat protein n=1 Tax=Saccharothrix carnea TaxID=1280637 RepID=A0A2P8I2K4_SACCR|nr:hypothetical protein [Saccharothrix carnea]PSL52700.1 putative HAF family extracellular repeat protein [Saccharothrix carnea]